ncbi:MAG: hypothetical protein M0Q95_20335 [Porticoccaceae bacterium]|nr:hypothetical protein [Porticoccaceae bacterium]
MSQEIDVKTIIEIMGGRAEVRRITGLTNGRISQMIKDNHIPKSWMTAFRAMRPSAFASHVGKKGAKETEHA